MEYADFPYAKQKTSYISQERVLEYINDFAKHFDLLKHIKVVRAFGKFYYFFHYLYWFLV